MNNKTASTDMAHKFAGGTASIISRPRNMAARGQYRIVQQLPVENDNRLAYRIKNAAESFERIAEERQLSRGE